MVKICAVNCLRGSNLVSMTIHDFKEAKRDREVKGAYRFYNIKYKTSFVYGEKLMTVSGELYDRIKTLINMPDLL